MNIADNPHLHKTAVSRRFSFRLKRHEKEFNRYVDKLGITTDGEMFVLHCILSRDWNRDLILISIEKIKLYNGLVSVKCRTRNGCYDFSVAHLGGDGWNIHNTQQEQEISVRWDLYHKMD